MEELKNTVIQTLESNGVLGKLRAQLRSSVFSVIENQDSQSKMQVGFQWENPLAPKITETQEGQLCIDMIREFLEFYRMDYTLSTFLPECSLSQEPKTRNEIENQVGLDPTDTSMPLLMHLIVSFMKGVKTKLPNGDRPQPAESSPASEKQEKPASNLLDVDDEVKSKPMNDEVKAQEAQQPADFQWNDRPNNDSNLLEPMSSEAEK